MRPDTTAALEAWTAAHKAQRTAASDAIRTAFPPLGPITPVTGCCDIRFGWAGPHGEGAVCVDEDSRASIDFRRIPQRILGAAIDEIFGGGWFDDALDGIADAEPGTYCWDDETRGTELQITVREDATADMSFDYASVPDVVTLLDELHAAYCAAP